MIRQCFLRLSSISLLYSHNPLRAFVLGGLALMVLAFAGPALSQTQLGTDFDGEGVSGYSVSLSSDGKRVAIGAPNANGIAGQVRIYEYNGTAWTQLGDDIDGEAAGDASGVSVSLSSDGTRVAIGAYLNDDNGVDSGHVRVYDWNGSAWTKLGLDIDGEAANDLSGYSVSLSSDGTRVAIGAPRGNGNDSGQVRIYEYNGTAWTQLGGDIDGEAAGDASGVSVSLSSDGTRVAIGAYLNDDNGVDSGHVRIYEYNGTAWIQLGADIDGAAAGDQSGYSVSLSSDGTRVAIGAPGGYGNDSGQVRIYEYNGTAWIQLGADIDGEAADDQSGYSVSLSSDGTRVAIGARFNDANGSNSGHVRVYDWNGSAWIKVGDDIDGEAASDQSGYSVSLSSDGTRVAIGAPENDSRAGHVRVYRFASASSAATPVPTLPLFGLGILVSLLGFFGLRKLRQ